MGDRILDPAILADARAETPYRAVAALGRAAEAASPDVRERQNFVRKQIEGAPPKFGHFAAAPFYARTLMYGPKLSRPGQAPPRQPHPGRDGRHAALVKLPIDGAGAITFRLPSFVRQNMQSVHRNDKQLIRKIDRAIFVYRSM